MSNPCLALFMSQLMLEARVDGPENVVVVEDNAASSIPVPRPSTATYGDENDISSNLSLGSTRWLSMSSSSSDTSLEGLQHELRLKTKRMSWPFRRSSMDSTASSDSTIMTENPGSKQNSRWDSSDNERKVSLSNSAKQRLMKQVMEVPKRRSSLDMSMREDNVSISCSSPRACNKDKLSLSPLQGRCNFEYANTKPCLSLDQI